MKESNKNNTLFIYSKRKESNENRNLWFWKKEPNEKENFDFRGRSWMKKVQNAGVVERKKEDFDLKRKDSEERKNFG